MTNPALDRLLAEVRAGGDGHRHRWAHHPDAEAEAPWSDADEDALAAFDPGWLRSAADELDRARSAVREVGAELGRLAGEAVGDAAAEVCARLAASSHCRADAADALYGDLRGAGGRIDDLLDTAARRVLRTLDTDDARRPAPAPASDPPPGYLALLRVLRDELATAVRELPELLDPAERAGRLDPPHPAGRAWTPEPGGGPLLPGVEARRVEPGYGVRIARLPDGPAG